jgi:hypothetical protein
MYYTKDRENRVNAFETVDILIPGGFGKSIATPRRHPGFFCDPARASKESATTAQKKLCVKAV